jgi:hypothetical protein
MNEIRITPAGGDDAATLRLRRDELAEGSLERSRVEDMLAELEGPDTRPF